MKTSILFSAILLIATGSYAQTTVTSQSTAKETASAANGQLSSQSNAASSTSVQSNAIHHTEDATVATAAKAKKEATMAKQEAKNAASSDSHAGADVQAGSMATGSVKGNKTGEKTSINGQATVSTKMAETTGNQVKHTGEATAVKVKTTTVKTVQAVKVKPVAIKANTSIKTNTGIKIK